MAASASDAHPYASDQLSLAWAAGFFDGEGCIRVNGASIRIVVSQVDPAPIVRFRELFGGQIRHVTFRSYRRPIHVLELGSRSAASALQALRPYLVAKAEQADAALEFQSGITKPKRGSVTDPERQRRAALGEKIRLLKWRAYEGVRGGR